MISTPSILLGALVALQATASASPMKQRWLYEKYFDLQGHRGGTGEAVENTLPALAWGLLAGVTSLEVDVGITKDGVALIYHDEIIDKTKCKDTAAAWADDKMFPYVGKSVANLTLAQIKTLDCGSLRLTAHPMAEVYPGTKLSTMDEMFDFVDCATSDPVLYNIETKVNPEKANATRSPEDFIAIMDKSFAKKDATFMDRITHQSFDWRMAVLSKKQWPTMRTGALISDASIYNNPNATTIANLRPGATNRLAGIDLTKVEGATVGERVARAAKQINADNLAPAAASLPLPEDELTPEYTSTNPDASSPGYVSFITKDMVDTAHALGMKVKAWTINRKNAIEPLINLGVDGIITDYPSDVRVQLERNGKYLAPKADYKRVMGCLKAMNQVTKDGLSTKGF